jgi:predicted NUDIX family NTP pyrophosphohydrolase
MPQTSAGILAYRTRQGGLEVLLVHPGGPFWRNKDFGAWSIPKGEYGPDEDAESAARREFFEELGLELTAPLRPLGEIRQRGGKHVVGFALPLDLDPRTIRSNGFELEWPPRSGRLQTFPEVDRADWFPLEEARARINQGQLPLLDRLETLLRTC